MVLFKKIDYKVFFGLILIISAISCSPQKRLTRICRNNPSLCVKSDTMRDTSYIISEYERFDSIYLTLPNDTIVIENDKVWTRIIRAYDTITVTQQVEPDTVIQIRERIKVEYKTLPEKKRNTAWILVVVSVMWILLLIRLSK